MGPLILQIAALAVTAILGFVAGWLVRASDRPRTGAEEGDNGAARRGNHEAHKADAPDTAAIQAFLSGLQQLTQSVATDVGAHNHRVQRINDELVAAAPAEAKILSAVKNLVRANETMQSQLSTAEVRLQTQAQEIERHVREARTDALTKLGNRRAFEEEMKRSSQAANDPANKVWLMLIDLDRFKKFNDTYGHPAGDEVLRGVSRVLREQLKDNEVACRHGGEEFAVMFADASAESARKRAERIRKSISQEIFQFEGLDLRVTTSSGLAQFLPAESTDQVFKRCDEALYEAKNNGRNCGYWHDGSTLLPIGEADSNTVAPAPADVPESDPFLADMERRIAEWKRGGPTLSVIILEADQPARFVAGANSAGGDSATDAVLRFLQASLRQMDHVTSLKPGRFGVILPGVALPTAGEAAERIRSEIARNGLKARGRHLTLTVSAGIAEVTQGDDRTDVLGRADSSLQAAKKAGGNCSFLSSKTQNSIAGI